MHFNTKAALLAVCAVVAQAGNLRKPTVDTLPVMFGGLASHELQFLDHAQQVERLQFLGWSRAFDKQYETVDHLTERFYVWKASSEMVMAHNERTDVSYTLEMNEFADMTHQEFIDYFGLTGDNNQCVATTKKGSYKMSAKPTPRAVDWRKEGVVSHVKNQGQCGSCWTFSTTGCLEAHHAIYHKEKVLLSEQQLVDCAGAFNNNGCNGGLPSQAFEYIYYAGGLDTEEEYPYVGKTGTVCKLKGSEPTRVQVKGVHNITQYHEEEITDALAHAGPVSIAYQVAPDFRLYAGGVYDSTKCGSKPTDVNHAVLAVGYDISAAGKPFYIVKNSWGPKWGIDGYFHLVKDKNMCGVSDCASFPIV